MPFKDPEKRRAKNKKYKANAQKKYRETHREEILARAKAWRDAEPQRIWARKLKKYGLTPDDYERILISQNGVCAICRKAETHLHQNGKKTRLVVDHDHTTNKVRGLLCGPCNLVLGHAKDSPLILRFAANYLEKSSL